MIEYLVQITVNWPPDGDRSERDRLIELEQTRAQELGAQGVIAALWRIPGRWENVGIWRAEDPTALDGHLRSLPFFPWLDISVTALATHPNDPKRLDERNA